MVFTSFLEIISDFVFMLLSIANTFILSAFSMSVFLDLTLGHMLIIVIVFSVIYSMIFGGSND